ncbi:MAG: MarR family transcriptional regulator [Chloroflexi bacterium]|jgi:DNA-binding MarR family transcriptional regulator|nr:MarR family transcriptional regulator [Chloroflexota bacterium]
MSSADIFVNTLHQWIKIFMRRSMRNFLGYVRESGLSMSQLGALFHIHRMGSSGVTDLGDHLGVTSAAVSQMLERLVQQALISRTEDPNDRRVKQIVLTDKGCQILEESIRARQGWLDDLAVALSPAEKEQITAALNILIDKGESLGQTTEIPH